MNNQEIINDKYAEAVKGLSEKVLSKPYTEWYDYINKLPEELKTTYLIVVLDSQVFNGGFHQYFVNGYGQFSRETIECLIKVGAVKRSELLEKALSLVNAGGDVNAVFRKKLLDKDISVLFVEDELIVNLDELDRQYYSNESEELEQLLGNYLRGI